MLDASRPVRAAQFKADGRSRQAIGNQWYAVAYFYGAYRLLYASIAVDYEQLHGASIAVRYGMAIDSYEPTALSDDFDRIADAAIAGLLVAA